MIARVYLASHIILLAISSICDDSMILIGHEAEGVKVHRTDEPDHDVKWRR